MTRALGVVGTALLGAALVLPASGCRSKEPSPARDSAPATTDFVIPYFPPDDERLSSPGLIRLVRRAETTDPDGRTFSVFTFVASTRMTLGAMVSTPPDTPRFVGRARVRIGGDERVLEFDEVFTTGPRGEQEDGVSVSAGAIEPTFRWVEIETDRATWFPDEVDTVDLQLEFEPSGDGPSVRLPATGHFAARVAFLPPD